MKEFAGTMREQVELWQPTPARDALGGEGGDWTLAGLVWASAVPIGHGPEVEGDSLDRPGRWRLTLRPCAVAVGDRLARATMTLDVREVTADPALPDRVAVLAEVAR